MESNQKLLKIGALSSPFDAQHLRDRLENESVTLLVVSLGMEFNEIHNLGGR